MGENKRLFPIGILSKLTGVHIRCLRYYEQLGILHPAHVDNDTGYRYYTYRQMRVVEAIQYCVELDIPLKKFAEYISEENGEIDYASLVAYGKQVTEEKLDKILSRQQFVEEMQTAMDHAKECKANGKIKSELPKVCYYCKPFSAIQDDIKFQSELVKLIHELESKGLKAGYDAGVLLRVTDGKPKAYLFIDVKNADTQADKIPELITIPKGNYLCAAFENCSIADAECIFADELANYPNTVITETELFMEQFPYEKPIFELRFYLGELL